MKLKRILLMLVATLCYLWATSQPLNFTPLMKHNGVTGYQWKYGHIDSALTFGSPYTGMQTKKNYIQLYLDNYYDPLLTLRRNDSLNHWSYGEIEIQDYIQYLLPSRVLLRPHGLNFWNPNINSGSDYTFNNTSYFNGSKITSFDIDKISLGNSGGWKYLYYPTAAATNDTLLTNSILSKNLFSLNKDSLGPATSTTITIGYDTATGKFVRSPNAKPYKSYVALLTQSGTNAPTAIVLENDTGLDINWIYSGIGQYDIDFSNIFNRNKTSTSVIANYGVVNVSIFGPGWIGLNVRDFDGSFQDGGSSFFLNNSYFEIRIYP